MNKKAPFSSQGFNEFHLIFIQPILFGVIWPQKFYDLLKDAIVLAAVS